jgi:hypothetical protein
VRVPEGAAAGIVKVTLSYPDWKDCKVAPLTVEIPMRDVKPEDKAAATSGDLDK